MLPAVAVAGCAAASHTAFVATFLFCSVRPFVRTKRETWDPGDDDAGIIRMCNGFNYSTHGQTLMDTRDGRLAGADGADAEVTSNFNVVFHLLFDWHSPALRSFQCGLLLA